MSKVRVNVKMGSNTIFLVLTFSSNTIFMVLTFSFFGVCLAERRLILLDEKQRLADQGTQKDIGNTSEKRLKTGRAKNK